MAIKGIELKGMVTKATKKWTKQKKAEERDYNAFLNRRVRMATTSRDTVKDAAYAIMETAYNKVSGNGRLPAMARQIMYAARGYILKNSDCKKLNGEYFRGLLKDYMLDYPEETADWIVAFDPRGTFHEPHTDVKVPIGTIQVQNYLASITAGADPDEFGKVPYVADKLYPTVGPVNRFSAILFVEKEGFMPLFEEVKLAERFDIAVMSTKGMSVDAARRLVDNLCVDIPVLVVRDFDKAGFSIAATLRGDTKYYTFTNEIEAMDLGLRLEDVEDLESEADYVKGNPYRVEYNLQQNGATPKEIQFLLPSSKRTDSGTWGERVELNTSTSQEFITWLEKKLTDYGVKKFIPDEDVLETAYSRAYELRCYQNLMDDHHDEVLEELDDMGMPDDLAKQIAKKLKKHPEWSWDVAINEILKKQL